jgi:hypothetical protein
VNYKFDDLYGMDSCYFTDERKAWSTDQFYSDAIIHQFNKKKKYFETCLSSPV